MIADDQVLRYHRRSSERASLKKSMEKNKRLFEDTRLREIDKEVVEC